ncbi:MAG: N-acetyl-gamma-glutamyl-phosphate reductase [Myxococcota bacterium]|jgi:N-acetyl-gamma-glutamyl-phosphate reductase
MAKTIKAAVIGASGYSGMELIRILDGHPEAEAVCAFSSGRGGAADPNFTWRTGACIALRPFDMEALLAARPDVVFCATPNETSHGLVPKLVGDGLRVIDLSGSFRLRNSSLYSKWYGFPHEDEKLLSSSAYGLPEVYPKEIAEAALVANPGCYATSVILPLIPLATAGVVDPSSPVICDSKSGVSGAGRAPTPVTHFCEVDGSFKAYGMFSHRHLPEIEQESGLGDTHKVIFTPHLLPINRGILSTIYLKLNSPMGASEILDLYNRTYAGAPFVRIFPEGELPEIKWVDHTNFCDIGVAVEPETGHVIVISCLDNLLKGAAGQAVQNMNLMFGLDQTAGLR